MKYLATARRARRRVGCTPSAEPTLIAKAHALCSLLAAALLLPVPVHADEPAVRAAIVDNARSLFLDGEVDALDRLASRYRTSKERTPAGVWKLSLLYRGIASAGPRTFDDPEWKRLDATARAWLKARPASAAAAIASAELFYWHAWTARDRSRYRNYLNRAGAMLDEHRGAASLDPEWYAARIAIADDQDASKDRILTLGDEALALEPYYYDTHYAVVRALQAKSGGSLELMQQYLETALEHSKKEGLQAYARIGFHMTTTSRDAIEDLNSAGMSWPPLRLGLEQINKDYPDPWNLNIARVMSCMSRDKEYYLDVSRQLAGRFAPVATWDGDEWHRICEDWAIRGIQYHGSVGDLLRHQLSYLKGYGGQFWAGVALVALILTAAFQLVLSIRERLARAGNRAFVSGRDVVESAAVENPGDAAYEPAHYPRTYVFRTRAQGWVTVRGPKLAVVAFTAGMIMAKPEREFDLWVAAVAAVYLLLAAYGVYLMMLGLRYRVVLEANGFELRKVLLRYNFPRAEIAGWRHARNWRGKRVVVVATHGGREFRLDPAQLTVDAAFWGWLASFPQLPGAAFPAVAEAGP